ncbi:hypothetical protein [Streptomyces sp. NPDC059371]|uniref:hypothetical protein n=1 Tax=Streptomyces sp. NPDC059371 TaxID=3346812 RepID=UPI0036B25A8F
MRAPPLYETYGLVFGGLLLLGARAGELTSSGVDGVAPAGAGAGPVDAVRQIGSAPSLSILTAVAAIVSTGHTPTGIGDRTRRALTGAAVLLVPAVLTVVTLIVPARATRKERLL